MSLLKKSSKSNSEKSRNAKAYGKIFGLLLAGFILTMLIISVPAKAFVLDLAMSQNNVEVGELVVFTVSVDINSNENLQISKLMLELKGDRNYLCEFNVDGIILSGCNGITINASKIFTSEYSYSYGYGYGAQKLSYEIRLNTDNYDIGEYSTKLSAFSGNSVHTQEGHSLTISSGGSSSAIRYSSSSSSKVCLNGWKCSDWSSCSDGEQTRTCEMLPNCYLDNMPAEKRVCLASGNEYDEEKATIRLFNGLSNGFSGDALVLSPVSSGGSEPTTLEELNQINDIRLSIMNYSLQENDKIMILLLVLILLIVILIGFILGILIARSMRRARRRKIRRARRRRLERIRYRPVK
jgi:hypothetical protein